MHLNPPHDNLANKELLELKYGHKKHVYEKITHKREIKSLKTTFFFISKSTQIAIFFLRF